MAENPASQTDSAQLDAFETRLHDTLWRLLQQHHKVDEMEPVLTDIEAKWQDIGASYLTDGVREFRDYPTVALGWIMYVGMALATFWDDDWAMYAAVPDLYLHLRDKRGFDCLDEAVREEILGLKDEAYTECEDMVRSCAQVTHSLLAHEGFEPGTPQAFHGFVRCLHQLYLMGAATQLFALGYRMKPQG